jgi:osmotically-inducible protein OsmY
MELDKRPDPEISSNALERLHDELLYSSEFLKVTTKDGWLTLEGSVEWGYQRDRAQKAVRAVRGVVGVSNNLKPKLRVAASEVKHQIEEALKRTGELDANRAAVEAGRSKVTVKGLKSWAILDGSSVHGESVGR